LPFGLYVWWLAYVCACARVMQRLLECGLSVHSTTVHAPCSLCSIMLRPTTHLNGRGVNHTLKRSYYAQHTQTRPCRKCEPRLCLTPTPVRLFTSRCVVCTWDSCTQRVDVVVRVAFVTVFACVVAPS